MTTNQNMFMVKPGLGAIKPSESVSITIVLMFGMFR